jgi:hypothetical protein
MFAGITDEVVAILPVILPIAVGIFAIGLALRFGRRVIGMFS